MPERKVVLVPSRRFDDQDRQIHDSLTGRGINVLVILSPTERYRKIYQQLLDLGFLGGDKEDNLPLAIIFEGDGTPLWARGKMKPEHLEEAFVVYGLRRGN